MDRFIKFFFILIISISCSTNENMYVIETEKGDITFEVYPEKAPVTVANFIKYFKQGNFDSANFFRVVRLDNQPDDSIRIEVIQGLFVPEERTLDPIEHETTEMTGILHKDGVVSMARFGPGTASYSFFICVNDQPQLDFGGMRNPDGQGFATFGKVIDGMDVVREIQAGETDHQTLKDPVVISNFRKK